MSLYPAEPTVLRQALYDAFCGESISLGERMTLHIPREDKEALCGVIDLHVHSQDIMGPAFDLVTLAKDAREVNYRGLYIMANGQDNSQYLHAIRSIVPGIGLWGGPILNLYVGGLNPFAVEAALMFDARGVKFGNFHTQYQLQFLPARPSSRVSKRKTFKNAPKIVKEKLLTVLDGEGKLVPEAHEILDLMAEADIMLATGHLSLKEIYVLIEEARKAGVRKMIITHPYFETSKISMEDQVKLAEMGAFMELCFEGCWPYRGELGWPPANPADMAETIKKVGDDKCVMASDMGEFHVPHPVETMRTFIRTMRFLGITDRQIERMTKDNPAKLMGIE